MSEAIEQVASFACGGEKLLGVLTLPAMPLSPERAAVLIVVGGPQYRAGAHRQFVKLARALAESGHASLRFDARGMGDSTGDLRAFEDQSLDIDAAVGVLVRAMPEGTPIALLGLCDGASAAMLYLDHRADTPVVGLCGLNPWVRSPEGLAQAQLSHYYGARLISAVFWRKLLSGEVGWAAAREFLAKVMLARRRVADKPRGQGPFQTRMARGCLSFKGRLALMLSGDDLTAREFRAHAQHSPLWRKVLAAATTEVHDFARADHTFSRPGAMAELARVTVRWLSTLSQPPVEVSA